MTDQVQLVESQGKEKIPAGGMFEKIFREVVRYGYILSVALMIASLAHSKWMMSVCQFVLTGAFVLERFDLHRAQMFLRKSGWIKRILFSLPYLVYLLGKSIVSKFRLFFRNIPALILASIFLMHIAGLIFTTDFSYAFKDLRTKLPLFLLPLFISTTSGFNRKQFHWLLMLFVAAVLARTFLNAYNLLEMNFVDIRDIAKSISHIIVSLLITFSIFILGNFITRRRTFPIWVKIIYGIIIVWFLCYLVLSRSGTGLVVTSITLFILLMILLFTLKSEWLKITVFGAIVLGVVAFCIYLSDVYFDFHKINKVDFSKLELISPQGNPYVHDTTKQVTENGNYVYIYIQFDELREAWNKRSSIKFDSTDRKNQPLVWTILRFLTSEGLRKDAGGINSLSAEEIKAIENGTANVIFTKSLSLRGLIYEFLWGWDEYRSTGNPTGSSLMQRLEFWKASAGIIRDSWLTGVGTGDMNEAFENQYQKMHTKLPPDQRWRSHNQFLSVLIGFGIFGLLWFLFAILYAPLRLGKFRDYFFLIFFIIIMISMVPEDTIETQAGVTFFAFFYSFLMFGRKEEENLG